MLCNAYVIFKFFLASLLLDICCHVKVVGSVKYRLVKNHIMKLALTCDDCVCVYQKVSPGGGYYCLEHGDLFSECLDRDQYYTLEAKYYLEKKEGKMNFSFAYLNIGQFL